VLIPDRSIALLLGMLTMASRLPFIAERLWEWDSVLYARALEHGFHVDDVLAGSRPHPPGYLFYVASAAIGRALGLDSDRALVAVSIVASGAAVALCYLLCRRFAGRGLALALAVAFASAPLVWLHGEVAMPYILLAPVMTGLALAFRDARGGSLRRVVVASFAYGALGGFRQDVLLFLFPLWLWLILPAPSRAPLVAAGALVLGGLTWFIPSALLSDGPVTYVTRSLGQLVGLSSVSANEERSIAVNVVLVGDSLLWAGLALTLLVIVVGLARALAVARGQRRGDEREAVFFGLWLLPALSFYLFAHIGEWGFVLSLVPGLYGLLAWLLRPIVARPVAWRAAMATVVVSAALGVVLFVGGDDPVFSRTSLVAHDRATDAKTAYIRDHLPSASTVVLASAEALVASYYLPDWQIRYSNAAARASFGLRLDAPTIIVIYEPGARVQSGAASRSVTVAPGITLELVDAPAGTVGRTSAILVVPARPRPRLAPCPRSGSSRPSCSRTSWARRRSPASTTPSGSGPCSGERSSISAG